MKEYNFLPMWYRTKIEKKEKIRFMVVLSITIVLLVINIFRIVNYRKDIIAANNKIKNINLQNIHKNKIKEKNKINKQFTINTYYDLKEEIKNISSFKYVDINKNKIFLQKEFNSMEEAARTLDSIKNNLNYEIKDIKIEELDDKKNSLKLEFKAGRNE
ncbi:hypothetical protein Z969_09060 [Clostridium novyi A str. 4570]|uniref:Fimbrial assembly protein n=1 Tax=Clostridium novyi A str. 4570 TaxID=1444290 RepID=A0AA88ZQZ5_CLONO|nr:hypothetical protein [Clostridium novyi]KGN00992.1 hypothetical protein Z969_09060 [Clostridium novyi A str. 4570]